ncbi:hypothetical protein BMR06_14380 [Methylococcaceae bacterium HT5]|nr:hypothetical protein BMR06_14380 [Methylococcaceae bacterium HT5]
MNKKALIFLIMLVTSSNVMALKGANTEIHSDKTHPSLAQWNICTVTMIGNFVGLTKATCGSSQGDTPVTVVSAKTGAKKTAYYTPHPKFDAENWNPKYDIAVVILKSGFDTTLSNLVKLLEPSEEEQFLKDRKSRFVLHSAGIDEESDECNTQGSNQGSSTKAVRFVTSDGCLVSKIYYESFASIDSKSPSRLYQDGENQVLPNWQIRKLFIDKGMAIEDLDERLFVLAPAEAIINHHNGDVESPANFSDSGAAAILHTDRTERGFVGFVHSKKLITRVTPHWPWILDVITKSSADYQKIHRAAIDSHNRERAKDIEYANDWVWLLGISGLVDHFGGYSYKDYTSLSPYDYDKNHIVGQLLYNGVPLKGVSDDKPYEVGQIGYRSRHAYGTPQYFRVIGLNADGSVDEIPSTAKDTKNWDYIGTRFPRKIQNPIKMNKWGDNGRIAVKGDHFVYYNPYKKQVEYFIAKKSGRYWYFPIDHKSNRDWEYMGTDSPDLPHTIYPNNNDNMTEKSLAPHFENFQDLIINVKNGKWARYINLPRDNIKEGREVRVARYSTWWTEVRTGDGSVRLPSGKEVTFIFKDGVWKLKG